MSHSHDRSLYPPARISMTPLLALADLFGKAPPDNPFHGGDARLTASGRAAIAHALKCAGVGAGDAVLVPAYHCPAMIEPVIWAGAEPLYYPLSPSLDIDIEQLESLRTGATRAVLAAHFFAQGRDLTELRHWCDRQGVALIEDCAHAMYSRVNGYPVGTSGDYAIASLWKFLPGGDGGVLYSARHDLPDLGLSGGESDLRTLYRLIEQAADKGRYRLLAPSFAALNLLRGKRQTGPDGDPGGSTAPDYSLSDEHVGAAAADLIGHLRDTAFKPEITRLRRDHFSFWLDAMQALPGCEPFDLKLDPHDAPYVFPLLLNDPDEQFPALKRAGFPVWRWEDLMSESCPVSNDYRWRLIQLPCHQSLSGSELDWMHSTLESVLR